MFRDFRNSLRNALVVALAGAAVGLVYGLTGGGSLWPDALKWALVGAILASAVYSALKAYLG